MSLMGVILKSVTKPQQTETHDNYFNVLYKIPSVDLEWWSDKLVVSFNPAEHHMMLFVWGLF